MIARERLRVVLNELNNGWVLRRVTIQGKSGALWMTYFPGEGTGYRVNQMTIDTLLNEGLIVYRTGAEDNQFYVLTAKGQAMPTEAEVEQNSAL